MILFDLRSYLKVKKLVALNELVIHFSMDADALRGLLSKWIHKEQVRQLPVDSSCGTSCCKCDATMTEFYEWTGK